SPSSRVGARKIIETVAQGFVIQHGAATQQRDVPPCLYLVDQGQRVRAKGSGRVAFRRVTNIQQMVRNALPLVVRGLGGADVHATVDGGGVHSDDLDGPVLRQRQRRSAFAGRGGACNT